VKVGRRDFLKYSIGVAGAAIVGKYVVAPQIAASAAPGTASPVSPPARQRAVEAADGLGTVVDKTLKFALVIDVGACIGCRKCAYACKTENNIASTVYPLWTEVFQLRNEVDLTGHASMEDLESKATTNYTTSPNPGMWYLAAACQHCDNPPCVKVCPVGATYKDKDGLVLMNYDRCIGCRLCIVACPYSARRFNWVKPEVPADQANPEVPVRPISVVEKCTFCAHRVRNGRLPRCVEVCPVQARHFGDINDPESEVSKILKANRSYRLLEELNTRPSVQYIARGKKWIPS
jgi:molybdopterin-containing oxidoreductase family iron-sulfur binding subunit